MLEHRHGAGWIRLLTGIGGPEEPSRRPAEAFQPEANALAWANAVTASTQLIEAVRVIRQSIPDLDGVHPGGARFVENLEASLGAPLSQGTQAVVAHLTDHRARDHVPFALGIFQRCAMCSPPLQLPSPLELAALAIVARVEEVVPLRPPHEEAARAEMSTADAFEERARTWTKTHATARDLLATIQAGPSILKCGRPEPVCPRCPGQALSPTPGECVRCDRCGGEWASSERARCPELATVAIEILTCAECSGRLLESSAGRVRCVRCHGEWARGDAEHVAGAWAYVCASHAAASDSHA